MDLEIGDCHTGKSHQGSYREIYVTRDNDEHHAGSHDADHTALDRQVRQVARRQEHAVAREVERKCHDAERGRDTEHTRVQLECAQPSPVPHLGQPDRAPPQSASDSSLFWTPSAQVGSWQQGPPVMHPVVSVLHTPLTQSPTPKQPQESAVVQVPAVLSHGLGQGPPQSMSASP